jgi:UDP-N-acetylglucosamine diphosphorylase/glucosamine-1-phosphate N-acetyltransferase
MNLCVFDDQPGKFYPASLTRSVGDIRCGVLKLRQRLQALFYGEQESVMIEDGLLELYRERHPEWFVNSCQGDTLFVNSRLKINADLIKRVNDLKPGESLIDQENTIIAGRVQWNQDRIDYYKFEQECKDTQKQIVSNAVYRNLADLISDNSRLIEYDYGQFFRDEENYIETEPGVTILNPYQVWIGEGVVLKPGVVVDASHGSVIIDENAEIMSHAVILGPCYIGKKSLIKVGAKIYGGNSIGPVCKVGGELEGTIIQAYSNKQHDGFLGHAYLGEWVNLGAGTNNSDLKNNYKPVSFFSYELSQKQDSGYQFLGSMIGDHVKTGINSTLNTGVVIGAGCNLWGCGLISDHIPSFSWGEAGHLKPYNYEAFIQTAMVVKQRRDLQLTKTEIDLLKRIRNREQQEN